MTEKVWFITGTSRGFGNEWLKMNVPGAPSSAINLLTDPQAIMSLIKSYRTVSESDTERTTETELDGATLAKLMAQNTAAYENESNLPPEKKAQRNKTLECLQYGAENSVLKFVWTFDKQTLQTVTCSMDWTDFMRTAANYALESSAPEELSPSSRALLTDLAYNSELKFYETYVDTENKKAIVIPKEVKKAVTLEDVLKRFSPIK